MVITDTTIQLCLFVLASFAMWRVGIIHGKALIPPPTVAECREVIKAADQAIEVARLKYATTAKILALPVASW